MISVLARSFSGGMLSAQPFPIAPTTPGSTLVVAISVAVPGSLISSIVTNAGDIFPDLPFNNIPAAFDGDGAELTTGIFWLPLGIGGATTMTITASGSFNAWIYELSGNSISIDDAGVNNSIMAGSGGTTATGPTLNGTGTQDFYIACMTAGAIVSVDAPWTLDAHDPVGGEPIELDFGAAYLADSGAQTPVFTQTSNGRWSVAAVAFKDTATPPPPPPAPCAALQEDNVTPVNGVFVADLSLFIIPATALYTELIPNSDLTFSETALQGRREIILDFKGSDGLWMRDLGTIFTWDTKARPVLRVWQPSIAPTDGEIYDRLQFHAIKSSLGMTGYGHSREMNIAHISTADLTLELEFDDWPTITLTVPNSGGVQKKDKITLPVNKWKLIEIVITSAAPFKIFGNDLELKVKQWGSTGAYQVLKPVVT